MLKSKCARAASFFVVACAIVACSDAELTFGGPLELSVTSNSPVSVTDSLILEYDVTGQSLLGLAVTWGDGAVDSVFFAGAQSASGRRAHLYSTDGSYPVSASVTDGLQGTTTEDLTVTVDP